MSSAGLRALALALAVTLSNAAVFWATSGLVDSTTFFSFWNRSLAECVFYTALYVLISARVLIWFHDRMQRYAQVRGRGAARLVPMAFGVAVFGSTLTWWLTVVLAVPTVELYGVILRGNPAEWTLVLLPFPYFVQFLFVSRSTVIWFLAAGITWPLVSILPGTGRVLSGYYALPAADRPSPPLGFLKVWNVFGYLVFLLSLLFQSG